MIVDFNKEQHSCIINTAITDHDSNIYLYKKFDRSQNVHKLHAICLAQWCKCNTSQNSLVLYTYPQTVKQSQTQPQQISTDLISNALEKINININDLPITHNQKFLTKLKSTDEFESIEFNEYYRNKNVYIISNMGSGKSNLLSYWFDKYFNNKNILYVSFRKSLSNNMSERLELINYMDVHVFTYDNEHKKLIC